MRCVGAQIFALTIADRAGSAPPIPTTENTGPTRIGPYSIISELGRGGMGVVYLAQHAQLGRIVALKVIPSGGSATSDLEMRFLREARTIARLSHPHIVTVHDAGRVHGHAYFSMDYFEDGDLARRLRAQPFTPREPATLMRSVGDAIAYSHAAGVLHRDLKPSNILLADGAPRVADFGLAAELDSSGGLTARTTVIGTPHYLAPEALNKGSSAQGVSSDIYSLGVILHEMLAGRTPFAGASPAELPGLLARGEAPALRFLAPQVPADLATICAKCLEFDPARRYASAAELAEDLRRFLAGEPIKARPVSAGAQLLRWARRRPALAATWLLSLLLAVGSLSAAFLINRERIRADQEAAGSAALATFLRQALLAPISGERERDTTFRAVLDAAVKKIPGYFDTAPLAEIDLRLCIAATYYSLGDYVETERQYRRVWELRGVHLGPLHPDTLRVAIELADCLTSLGRAKAAEALIRPTLASLVRLRGEGDPAAIGALQALSKVEQSLGQIAKAEALARDALALARRHLASDHELISNALVIYSTLLESQGKFAEACELCREDVAIAERHFGPDHVRTLAKRVSLVSVEMSLGHAKEAEASLRTLHAQLTRQLGPDHPETLRALNNLGGSLSKLGRFAEADQLFTELTATRRRTRGPDHPLTLAALRLQSIARGRAGHLPESIALMRELSETSARALGPTHLTTLGALGNLAGMLVSAGHYDEALEFAQRAYRGSLSEFGPDDNGTLIHEETLANTLGHAHHDAEAETHWRHLLATFTRLQPGHWHTAMLRGQLGKDLARLARLAEAEPLLRESYTDLMGRLSELPASRQKLPQSYAELLVGVYTALDRPADAALWRAKAQPPAP